MNKLAFPILAIVFVSACIGGGEQPTTAEGKGLEITSFSADQAEIQSGRTLRIIMDVENSGDAAVSDAKSLAFLIAPGDWQYVSSSEFQNFGKNLDPADPVRDLPADTDQVTWRLTAPTTPLGQARSDEFEGRVYYDYQTTAIGTVWLYSETEYESVRSAGGTLNKASFASSEAPLKVEVSASPDPPVIVTSGDIFTLTLKISNVGGGTIYRKSVVDYTSGNVGFAAEDLNTVSIDIVSSLDVVNIQDCLDDQELIRGRDLTISCDFRVDQIPAAKQSFPIEVTLDYGYFKSKTLSINVLGR